LSKVHINDLCEGMVSDQVVCDNRGVILLSKGIVITEVIIERLKTFELEYVIIQDESSKGFEALVENVSDRVYAEKIINIKDTITQIKDIIYSVSQRPYVEKCLAQQDYVLKEHSLRTAIVSTNMGLKKGYRSLNLESLAASVLVHDCGMEGKYKEDDIEHPLKGFIKLREDLEVEMTVALVCLQHHEQYNGGGFPFSFKRTQVIEFASLLAVVDYYDRLLINKQDHQKVFFDTIKKRKECFDPCMVELFASTFDWARLYNIPR